MSGCSSTSFPKQGFTINFSSGWLSPKTWLLHECCLIFGWIRPCLRTWLSRAHPLRLNGWPSHSLGCVFGCRCAYGHVLQPTTLMPRQMDDRTATFCSIGTHGRIATWNSGLSISQNRRHCANCYIPFWPHCIGRWDSVHTINTS